jgi:FkbM family methyltransferase
MHRPTVSFSQFAEDIVLDRCFFPSRKDGFYVEVGAYDPFEASNTQFFYRKGWHGINIEPNPEGFRRFQKYRSRDINLNLAISDMEKNVEFTVDSVYSGIKDETHFCRGRNPDAKTISVLARPLRSILNEHVPEGTEIDFMSIDCEGHDRIVLESNDWDRYRPKVILAEELGEGGDLDQYMLGKGYGLFFQAAYSKIYRKQS